NLAAGRLATRVVALNTALEMLMAEAGFAAFAPALEPLLTALANTARTVAVAVVSRQPAHLKLLEVRQPRLTALLRVVRAGIAAAPLPISRTVTGCPSPWWWCCSRITARPAGAPRSACSARSPAASSAARCSGCGCRPAC